MNNPSFSPRPAASVAGIARLIRQVCILREQGDAEGAVLLEKSELAMAIRDHRLKHGPEALPESELESLYAVEERRVADAAVLSELLLPRLVKALPASSGPAVAISHRPATRPLVISASGSAPSPAGSPAIPDLLDAMLAAERSDRRPVAAGKH